MEKVKFILDRVNLAYDQEGAEELKKVRSGYFRKWGKEIVEKGGNYLEQTVAFVEEADTGKVRKVIPENLTFDR